MARPLFLHAALATAALALRTTSTGGADPADPAPLAAEAEGLGSAPELPPIGDFRAIWTKRYESERHLRSPMPPSVRLVLGLFTTAGDFEYREVVRDTWLNQTGVCYWRRQPKAGCSVYVAFVVGGAEEGGLRQRKKPRANLTDEDAHREEGMLELDAPEGASSNKSEAFFDAAGRLFPWATHVGKADMDTYPLLHKLVRRMEAGRPCSLRHGPYEVIGRPHDSFGKRFEHVCGGNACPQFTTPTFDQHIPIALPGQPWRFLSGKFYALSMPLVQQVAWVGRSECHTGDCRVSEHVGEAALKKGFCVVLRRLDAWIHRTDWSDANYINDL